MKSGKLSVLMASGFVALSVGLGCSAPKAQWKDPADGTVKVVSLDAVNEWDLPCALAWEKMNRDVKAAQGWQGTTTGVILGREAAADIEKRITAMKDNARKGQAGSSPVEAFDDMVPEIAAWLAAELPKLKRVQEASVKQIIVVAPVANQLNNGSAAAVEGLDAALASLGTKLISNEAVRNNFIYVSQESAGGKAILDSAAGGKGYEVLDPTDTSGGKRVYSPDSIFFVTPRIYQTNDVDNGRITIMMDVRVQHPQTRQDLAAHTSSRRYLYHPYKQRWCSLADEAELNSRFSAAVNKKK